MRTIFLKKFVFYFFAFSCILALCAMEGLAADNISFKEFFESKALYAISVTRETIHDTDYAKLTPPERELVFKALSFILGQDKELSQLLDKHLSEDENFLKDFEERYRQLYKEVNRNDLKETFSSKDILIQYLDEKSKEKEVKGEFFFWSTDLGREYIENIQHDTSKIVLQEINDFLSSKEKEIFDILVKIKRPLPTSLINKSECTLKKDTNGYYIFAKQLFKSLSLEEISKFFLDKVESKWKEIEEEDTLKRFFDLRAKFIKNKDFFNIRKREKEKLLYFIETKISNKIKDENCLVIFNEMFFGKAYNENFLKFEKKLKEHYAPFTQEEFWEASSEIIKLSRVSPHTVFYANFLSYSEDISGKDYRKLIFDKSEKFPKKFFDESFISLESLLKKIKDDKIYKTFKNESLTYYDGQIISSYRKASYKDEANLILTFACENKPGEALYAFGDGGDTAHQKTDINDYISSEICYDLEVGIRHHLANYPSHGKMHLFISNTLPLSLADSNTSTRMRFNHLPSHIPLIFHVDPHEQDLFINLPTLSFFLNDDQIQQTTHDIFKVNKQHNLVAHEPLYSIPIRLGVGANVFTFKIWDVGDAFKKLEKYSLA